MPVSPSCVAHALRLLCMFKILCPFFNDFFALARELGPVVMCMIRDSSLNAR